MDQTLSRRRGAAGKSASSLLPTLLLSLTLSTRAVAQQGAGLTPTDPSGAVTLRDTLAAALAGSPDLGAFSAELRAREALTLQAGLRTNPALRTEVENVGGSGDRQGFEDTETTLLLSQLIELGGKRTKRRRLAAVGEELASWDFKAKRLDVLARATKAFITVLVAQERLTLATTIERVATEGVETVARSVSAGASPAVETIRARVTLGRVQADRARAERDLTMARANLAASWGANEATFAKVAGDLTHLPSIPPEARFLGALPDSPDLARWSSELREREASLALEEARAIPDVALGAGGRHFSDNGDNALVFEMTLPIPVFDRNQGAVAAARARLGKASHEAAAANVTAHAAVHDAYQRLLAAAEQATSLRTTILPAARASRAGTVDAFRQGLLRPLDLIESQRTLFELEGEHLAALEAAHLAAADLERLTAVSIEDDNRGDGR